MDPSPNNPPHRPQSPSLMPRPLEINREGFDSPSNAFAGSLASYEFQAALPGDEARPRGNVAVRLLPVQDIGNLSDISELDLGPPADWEEIADATDMMLQMVEDWLAKCKEEECEGFCG